VWFDAAFDVEFTHESGRYPHLICVLLDLLHPFLRQASILPWLENHRAPLRGGSPVRWPLVPDMDIDFAGGAIRIILVESSISGVEGATEGIVSHRKNAQLDTIAAQ